MYVNSVWAITVLCFFLTFPWTYALHFIHYLVYNRTYKRFTEELYTTTIFNMVYMIKLRFYIDILSMNWANWHKTNNQLKPLPKHTFVNHRGSPIHIASYRLSMISKKEPLLQDLCFSENIPTCTSIVKTITSNV